MTRIYKHTGQMMVKEIGNEKILVPLRSNVADMEQIYTLNETAAFIWERMDGRLTTDEIASQLADEYDVKLETAVTDVEEFVNEMRDFLELINR